MEIKKIQWFFISLILLIVGSFIVIFDFPQIQFFDNLDDQSYYFLDEEKKNIHQRLKIEFSIGVVFVFSGLILSIISIFWNFKK
ncbi:MAG: hypothetical protein ACE5RG_08330 [Candidatus Nitrosomaritimum yanchengensis]